MEDTSIPESSTLQETSVKQVMVGYMGWVSLGVKVNGVGMVVGCI